MSITLTQKFNVHYTYPVHFTHGIFESSHTLLRDTLISSTDSPARAIVFIDDGVHTSNRALVSQIETYFKTYATHISLMHEPIIVDGGEKSKAERPAFQEILDQLAALNPCRHSYIIAIGGGSMLDSIGLAASLIHRGVRLVRIPTTVLAQDDAGVGVKNGIDDGKRKNFLGTFAPPVAVINDFTFLTTLPLPYWLGGIAEAFKVAIIKDAAFFNLLETSAPALSKRNEEMIEPIIQRCAEIHLEHISSNGDPFEFGSARPLDFGHWAAHKLETLSNYTINHGEAVAIGIALDTCYAHLKKMITLEERNRIITAMKACGMKLYSALLKQKTNEGELEILAGLEEFRIHLGGRLTITLPTTIGCSQEIHHMDTDNIKKALLELQHLCV